MDDKGVNDNPAKEVTVDRRRFMVMAVGSIGLLAGGFIAKSLMQEVVDSQNRKIDQVAIPLNQTPVVPTPDTVSSEEINSNSQDQSLTLNELINNKVELFRNSNEYKKALEDIKKSRAKLALSANCSELDLGWLVDVHRPNRPEAEMSLGFDIKSEPSPGYVGYTRRTGEIVNGLLGHRTKNFVKQIIYTKSPSRMSFSYDGSMDIGYAPWSWDETGEVGDVKYVFVISHEATHSIDPLMASARNSYTPSEYLEAVRLKWEILSYSRKYPGEYLNKPDSYGSNRFYVSVGEHLGRAYVRQDGENLNDLLGNEGKQLIDSWLGEFGYPKEGIKFNRKVCRLLGQKLINEISAGSITVNDKLAEKISGKSGFENSLIEVFADIVADTLTRPEKINNDPELKDLVARLFSLASREEKSYEDITREIFKVSPETREVYTREAEVRTKPPEETSSPEIPLQITPETATEEQLEILKKLAEQELKMDAFYDGGIEIADTDLRAYSEKIQKVVKQFPMLRKVPLVALEAFGKFDPYMHVWDIRPIENGVDLDFIRNVVISDTITEEQRAEIKLKTLVLEGFINSPEFQNKMETMVPGYRPISI